MTFSEEFRSTGICHIHSNFSYDGTNSLEEIAHWARSHGLRFVLLTDHDLGFDQEKFKKYCAECSKNSDDVLLVPGIEYEVIHCGAIIHIGAIGVPVFLDSSVGKWDIISLVAAIHSHGGLAVLNHPNDIRKVLTKKEIAVFDFIELWNTKFDCSFSPNLQILRWLRSMDCHGPFIVSADIHDVGRFNENNIAYINMEVSSKTLYLSTIVDCLKQMRYRCGRGNWVISPDGTFQVPNRLYRLLPAVCLTKKKVFRLARFCVPVKYRKTVFNFVNRSWIR